MNHPDAQHLQRYYDGDLPPEQAEVVQAHLLGCPACSAVVVSWRRLSLALAATVPPAEAFSPEGRFWLSIAGRLPRRAPTWPLVPYLPPLVLGAIGAAVETLISAILLVYGLTGLGVLPPPGGLVHDALSATASTPAVRAALGSVLGWAPEEVDARLVGSWSGLPAATQDGLTLLAALLFLAALLLVVVAMYSSWAVCWTQTDRPSSRKEASDYGVRSHS